MLFNILRGLWLLRRPELLKDLGERRIRLAQINDLRRRFPNTKLSDETQLVSYREGLLDVLPGVTISDGTVLAFGDSQNGYGRITIGSQSWLGQYNNIRSGGGDIQIGSNCLIAQFCTLTASNHGMMKQRLIQEQAPDPHRKGVMLADDVWLGAGVTVLPGVSIGQGAVIGAGAVVTRDVPPYEIWAGVPARRIGFRE